MNVISDTGEYLATTFKDVNNLVWNVIGTKGDGKLADALDTLRSEEGDYAERTRAEMYKASMSGQIKPVGELINSDTVIIPTQINNQLKAI